MSDSGPIISIFAFYAFVIIMLGLIGGTFRAESCAIGYSGQCLTQIENPPTVTINFFTSEFYEQFVWFFGGVIVSIELLGVWNFVIFGPLIVFLFYLLLQFVAQAVGAGMKLV
jgi:hypothetical protein